MPTTTTKALPAAGQLGDLVRNLFNPGYNMISAVVTAPVGAVATPNVRLLGQPVKAGVGAKYVLVLAADIANATGVIADDGIHDLPVAGADVPYPLQILRRGPANVGVEGLAQTDVLGSLITGVNFHAALAALNPPIIAQAALAPTKSQVN